MSSSDTFQKMMSTAAQALSEALTTGAEFCFSTTAMGDEDDDEDVVALVLVCTDPVLAKKIRAFERDLDLDGED